MGPPVDKDSKEPPCITQVQAIQSHGKLHFLVTNRSHDIMKAAIPNAFGLRMLQKTVTDELGFALGKLQITSQSAHIYEGDWEQALKLVRCSFWEREPNLVFDPAVSADPRGMVVITIEDGEIVATVRSLEGDELQKIKGKTATAVGLKIAHLDLLSRGDHYFDVGLQLSRAEIALSKNIKFYQDKPLIF
ncbi:MAG: thymidylate synthase, partial [Patescibacteria group bacterium]